MDTESLMQEIFRVRRDEFTKEKVFVVFLFFVNA